MSTYRISRLAGGVGFKVQVADAAGHLRVVGILPDEALTSVWIAADRQAAGPAPADARPMMPAGASVPEGQ